MLTTDIAMTVIDIWQHRTSIADKYEPVHEYISKLDISFHNIKRKHKILWHYFVKERNNKTHKDCMVKNVVRIWFKWRAWISSPYNYLISSTAYINHRWGYSIDGYLFPYGNIVTFPGPKVMSGLTNLFSKNIYLCWSLIVDLPLKISKDRIGYSWKYVFLVPSRKLFDIFCLCISIFFQQHESRSLISSFILFLQDDLSNAARSVVRRCCLTEWSVKP